MNKASRRSAIKWGVVLLVLLGAAAYLLAPMLWSRHYRRHPFDAIAERITVTGDGHPGDPINIALVGSEADVIRAMTAAGWLPADPITLESSLKIAVDSVLRRKDDDAPVSNLYLFGRKQDLAFEKPVAGGPRHRHHVRFWKWSSPDYSAPVWFGGATYDERAGLSYTTGQVTHHIGPDVDAERGLIVADLEKCGWVKKVSWKDGFHTQLEGRNGGGDEWKTDGRLAIVELGQPAK